MVLNSSLILKKIMAGTGDAAQEVKVCVALSKDPGSSSIPSPQHLHGDPQPTVTPVPGDPKPPTDLCRYQARTWCAYTHAGKTFTHMK